MSAQVENYWKVQQGSVIACKCGRAHKKERRPRSSTCKECLAAENERRILFQIQETKRVVLKLIGLKQCPNCYLCKPFDEYSNRKKGLGRCKDCANALRREKWASDDEYRKSSIDRSKVYAKTEKRKDYRKRYITINAKDIAFKKAIGTSTPVHIKNCAVCGKYEVSRGDRISCLCKVCANTADGRNRYRNSVLYAYSEPTERKCKNCDKHINVFYGDKRKICDECAQAQAIKERRLKNTSNKARQRKSKVAGVNYSAYDVFKRDKWRCHLCGCKTQKRDIYAPNAAEIDHVIPISRGGKDTPCNVKCSCRACNSKKGDSIIPVTGNLFFDVTVRSIG